ncbi:MAG: MFS transporter, partial [Lachnospiraceae bacterium]|nr:MFS transporter [Lachnospiraceae bacterium]
EEAVTEKISFTQMFKNLFKILTPQLGLSYIVNMLSTLAIYLGSTLGVYFMVYYIGDSSKIMLYMFSCMLPVAVASLFGGYLQKYISPKKLLCICYIIVAISSCAIWFVGSSSLTLTLICICICSAAGGIANVPIMVLIWDLANQASRQKKVSADATVMSLNSLAIKVAQALASAVISMVLAITGYVANTEQTTRALNGILALRSLIPALLIVIAIVVLMLIRVKNVGGSENAA